jgi:organic radical activating enzyme
VFTKVKSEIINLKSEIDTSLPVMEDFYTLQGEGFHQGKAAYFIRLGGCDVGCVWCDVKDSWDAEKHPKLKIESLKSKVKKTPAEIVVITGGEPLMHDLTELTKELQAAGLKTHIETSGAHPTKRFMGLDLFITKKIQSSITRNCSTGK